MLRALRRDPKPAERLDEWIFGLVHESQDYARFSSVRSVAHWFFPFLCDLGVHESENRNLPEFSVWFFKACRFK
jgi:hypothetical protein